MKRLFNKEISSLLFCWNRRMMRQGEFSIVSDQKGEYQAILFIEHISVIDDIKSLLFDDILSLGYKTHIHAESEFSKRYKKVNKDIYFVKFSIKSITHNKPFK